MFLFITLLGIELTTGNFHGFMLFSQIIVTLDIETEGDIIFSIPVQYLHYTWSLICNVFSMNFFHGTYRYRFCLVEGATTLDILVVQHLTMAYAFLLTITVINSQRAG